jgi:hypothetical protein
MMKLKFPRLMQVDLKTVMVMELVYLFRVTLEPPNLKIIDFRLPISDFYPPKPWRRWANLLYELEFNFTLLFRISIFEFAFYNTPS